MVQYSYDAWGIPTIVANSDSSLMDEAQLLMNFNPFMYKGYYYDKETGLYYCNSRYYNPVWGRWISADSVDYLDPESINGLNLFAYCVNNPMNFKQESILGTSFTISSISVGGSVDGFGSVNSNRASSPWYAQTIVGAIPDLISGGRYLISTGMHQYFVYKQAKYYMFPILGANHNRLYIKSTNFGKMTNATLRQLITGNSKASLGSVLGNVAGVGLLTFATNALFNLVDNGFDFSDKDMWIDTGIDTAIGLGAYGLSIGTASLIIAGLAMAGVCLPGVVVVGRIIVLSIGFECLIREITGYWE